jgi:hypothetical protein
VVDGQDFLHYRQGDAVDCSPQAMGGAAAAAIWTSTLGM